MSWRGGSKSWVLHLADARLGSLDASSWIRALSKELRGGSIRRTWCYGEPLCFGKNYSPLAKFESEFHKTYTSQKLWKVPDPKLRKTLRKAIIQKIVPAYTDYINDNNVTSPKLTPKDLEEMLQEMFEG